MSQQDLPPHTIRIEVRASHQISLARQAVLQLAERGGMQRVTAYAIATAASELATNLIVHAGCGSLNLRFINDAGRWGLEIEAIDAGPGIADIELALRDGYSTRGSLGAGLGGAKRLMDGFEIESSPGQGTRVRAWKWQP